MNKNMLQFGTAGMRGIMGDGLDKMNEFTVSQISEALARYMIKHKKDKIVIAHDSRNNSKIFHDVSAKVFSHYGLQIYVFHKLVPISVLSFAIRELHCDFGVYITASHNPKEYNGYKVFNSTGGQISEEVATEISDLRELNLSIYKPVTIPVLIDDSILKRFYGELRTYQHAKTAKIDITYTGLFGTGNGIVDSYLLDLGYIVHTVESQSKYNGDFPELIVPNPELESSFKEAIFVAEKHESDIIIATDPDADRLGVMVRHNDKYVKLSGNQVGVLITDYLIRKSNHRNRYIVKSEVSTRMVDKICEKHNIRLINVPTGFKHIGAKIETESNNFMFGFEESCGYLIGTYARDKDSVGVSMIIAEITSEQKARNKTLVDYLESLYQEYGYFLDETLSIPIKSDAEMFNVVDVLKCNNLQIKSYQYADGMLKIYMLDGSLIMVRKSGTEPKLKIYVHVMQRGKESAVKVLNKYIELMRSRKYEI